MNPEEFEKRVQLNFDPAGAAAKFTVVYDKFKMNATVQSEPLSIPETTAAMVLHIAPGALAQRGGRPTEKEVVQAVEIPGLNSLAIEKVEPSVVTGDDGEPQHVLTVQASMVVDEREMARMTGAWLLPARKDAAADEPAWSDPAEVDEDVLKRARKVALTVIPQESEASDTHLFRFKAEPGAYLFVRVGQGLKSVGGYRLGAKSEAVVQVKAFAPELAIMSKGSLLALNGDKKLPILVRDLPGVHVEIARVLPQQLHLLASQSDGSFSQPEFYRGLTPDHLTERFDMDLPFAHVRPGKTHYETVDFSRYLKNAAGERRGVFLLSVRGYEPAKGAAAADDSAWGAKDGGEGQEAAEGEGDDSSEQQAFDPSTIKDTRLVLVTDLGFLIKKAVDGSRDVFVQSISGGAPVADATVEVWGKNGLVLAAQKTDATGLAHLPDLKAYTREKLPVVMVVRKGDDLSFMPLDKSDRGLDLSRFDIGGAMGAGLPNQTRAYLFSDRGIYRPGDTMHFGVLVKSGDWEQSASGLPIEAELVDARGLTVKREKLVVGPGGMAEVSHTTFDSSPTGNYTLNVNLARDTGQATDAAAAPLQLGSVTVKVQEFMPDRMKVSAHLSAEVAEGWVSPKDLKARIDVQNLFGAPAQKRRVETVLTLSPAIPAFRSYPDYAFFDPQRAKERYSEPLENTETDAQGQAVVDLRLERYAAATYQLHLLAKAFEPEGGRSVAAEATTLVSDLPYLVGFKADGDLAYVARNTVRKAQLVAIDPAARKTAVKGLKLQHVERRVLSVLVKQQNGLFKYESRPKEVVMDEQPLAIPAEGFQLALDTGTPGNFGYVIRSADGLEMNRIDYSVAGTHATGRRFSRW